MNISYISVSSIPSRTANSMHVMKMCQAMVQEGCTVTLYAPQIKGIQPALNVDLWRHYGVSDRFPIRWLESLPCLRGYDYAWKAVRAAKANGVSLVYTRSVPVALLSRFAGMSTILEIHSPPTGMFSPTFFAAFLRQKGRRRIVVISEALLRWLRDRHSVCFHDLDILVAHDGVDLERFADLPTPSKARCSLGLREAFTVVYAGHLYSGRGIEQLLDLAKAIPAVEFLFVGGEPKSVDERQREVTSRGLNNVTFVGFVENIYLPSYLAAGDVLAMPYQSKVATSGNSGNTASFMSPLKMFEYMAAGRLIIASDLPVLKEVLNDDIAIMCEPNNLKQWKEAIVMAKKDNKLIQEKSKHGKRIAELYTWRARTKRCLEGMT